MNLKLLDKTGYTLFLMSKLFNQLSRSFLVCVKFAIKIGHLVLS